MSSAVATREPELDQASPLVLVKHDPTLEAMAAPRADAYREHIKDFLDFARARPDLVDLPLLRDYFRELNARPYSNGTKRIKRQAVKARLRAALDGSMDFNRAAAFREALAKLDREVLAPKVQAAPVGSDKVIRRDEFDRLIAAASNRDELLLDFLWTTGCRVSELTGIRIDRC